ncbi:Lcl C-terminal domain-containing protein [Treponema sp. R80B11-R83G3]
MKKLFALTIILSIIITTCEDSPNYGEIGKTGPGGGIIFFAEGGQYKECSGELGNSTWDAAVATARNYKGGGFTNWHLPDRGELDLMYKNLKQNDLGGFSNNYYWSSVADNSSSAYVYVQDFGSGNQYCLQKSFSYSVRAVRSYDNIPVTPTVNTTLKIKNESSTDISEVIWQGVSFAENTTENSIRKGTTVTKTVQPGSGYIYFKRSTNPIAARTSILVVIAKDEQKEFTFLDNTSIVDVDNPNNTGTLNDLQPILTTLKIKNESLTEITDVIWQGVSFKNNQYENSIKPGTNVTATVSAGGGYIFFKRKSNPITARTNDMVIIEKYQQEEFTFSDTMLIVEVNNPNNTGTLHDLPSTVVFWDDAEGEMQQYYLKQSFVGYYKDGSELLSTSSNNFYTPKNGNKSIAVGGTNTALLQLKINLEKRARFSFWYANKYMNANGTVFSINGIEKAKWVTDINWSFMTFDLDPGENNIIWAKKDGYYSGYPVNFYYLSLDDILIYYTE